MSSELVQSTHSPLGKLQSKTALPHDKNNTAHLGAHGPQMHPLQQSLPPIAVSTHLGGLIVCVGMVLGKHMGPGVGCRD